MTKIKCKICGSYEDPDRYTTDVRDQLKTDQICLSCYHWKKQLKLDAEERGLHHWAVINGTHYIILPYDPDAYFCGYGGREFKIKFNDGTIITTRNLWCQGDIPDSWRDKFPDNATFIKD